MIYFSILHLGFCFVSANPKTCRVSLSTASKIAKYFFQFTQLAAIGISNSAVLLILIFDKSLPLNPLWIFEHLAGYAEYQGIGWTIFEKTFTFVNSQFLWKMCTVQGYCFVSDILISVLSISFCQRVSHR